MFVSVAVIINEAPKTASLMAPQELAREGNPQKYLMTRQPLASVYQCRRYSF